MTINDRVSGYTDEEMSALFDAHVASLGKTAREYLKEMGENADEWFIPGLVCDSLTIFYGKPEAGKSTLARNVIAGVTTGNDVLGVTPRNGNVPLNVLVIGSEANTRKEYPLKLKSAGANLDRVIIKYAGDGTVSENAYQLADLGVIDLVVVDNAQGLAEGRDLIESATASFVYRKLEPFISAEIPVILIHHASTAHRNSQYGNRMQGNTQFEAMARWHVEVQKDNGDTRRIIGKGNLDTVQEIPGLSYDARTHLLTLGKASGGRQNRSNEVLDRRKQIWDTAPIMSGASQSEVARQIAEKFSITERLAKADLVLGEREGFIIRTPGASPLYSRVDDKK